MSRVCDESSNVQAGVEHIGRVQLHGVLFQRCDDRETAIKLFELVGPLGRSLDASGERNTALL